MIDDEWLWMELIAREWHEDLADDGQDTYGMEDGKAIEES